MKQFGAGVAVGIALALLVTFKTASPGPRVSDQPVALSQKVIKALDDELFTISQELLSISDDLDDIKTRCVMR